MSNNTQHYEATIVGGGSIGCAIARELATDHDVVLLEKDQIASGATGHATGNTSVVTGYADNPDLAHYCNDFFRSYDGTGNVTYTERPRVTLIPESMETKAKETAATSADNGFRTSYLTAEEVNEKYPGVFNMERFVGGIDYQDIGWVDPYAFSVTLQKEAADAGADIETGVRVEEVRVDDDSVRGVRTSNGAIESEYVIVAAGWHTRPLLDDVISIPTYPFRWQAVDLEPGRDLGDEYPMGLDVVDGFYWRGEHNGNLHVGGGEYKVQQPGSVRTNVKESYRDRVARLIPEKLQGLEQARIIGEHTCESGDTATPDTDPIIDMPTAGPDGLGVATGFHGCGIMAAPAAARAIRSMVTGEQCPFPIEQYRLNRFDRLSNDFEFTPLLSAYKDI